ATRVGGIPEVLRDGESGILLEPSDVEGLADAMEKLCSSANLREGMGRCGRARGEGAHTPARFMGQLEGIYRELLGAPRIARGRTPVGAIPAQRVGRT